MSMPYELEGRVQQKQRTRLALIDAARDLVAHGLAPTVEDAAEAASVSRATAYRYFANQHALLAAAHPETAATSLLPDRAPEDPEARLDLVVTAFTRMIVDTEAQQRTMLRLSLEADDVRRDALPLRQGRAIGWIEEALEPLRADLDDAQIHRLALAVRSATGIEALVWLTDIAGLSRRDAVELMRWSARAMCRAAIDDGGPARPMTKRSSRARRARSGD
jgi:AcrR family transcriptional regulator